MNEKRQTQIYKGVSAETITLSLPNREPIVLHKEDAAQLGQNLHFVSLIVSDGAEITMTQTLVKSGE